MHMASFLFYDELRSSVATVRRTSTVVVSVNQKNTFSLSMCIVVGCLRLSGRRSFVIIDINASDKNNDNL